MEKQVSWREKNQKWINVIVCAFMIFVTLGFCSSNRDLYFKAIVDAHDIPRSLYSIAQSCRFVATAISNIFFGYFVYKFGTKKLILGGFIFLIASSVLNSVATNLFVFYLADAISGIGFSFCGTAMVGGIVNRWFKENTGTIMGAVLAVNGIGGAIAAQIVSPMINASTLGYQNAYRLVAVILLVAMLVVALFFKGKTREETEDAPATSKKKKRGRQWVGIDYSQASKKVYFYGAAVCIFLTGTIIHGVSTIRAPHFSDVGIDAAYIATVASVSSLCLTGSKFFAGFLYDKLGLRKSISICCMAAVISMVLMGIVHDSVAGRVSAMAYSIFSAIALPLETIMLPLYAADLFGEKSYDKILGIFVSLNTAGYAVGGPVINGVFDLTGSYISVIFIMAAVMLGVTIAMQFVISSAHKLRDEILGQEELKVNSTPTTSIEA